MSLTIAKLLKSAESELDVSDTPRLDVWILLSFASNKPRSWLLANSSHEASTVIGSSSLSYFEYLVKRRASGVPISFLTGNKEFYGFNFIVTKHTLIPRPESETIVQEAISSTPQDSKLLDVGTGTGAIAVSIAANRPDLKVYACDNSPQAIKIAQKNAHHHQVKVKIEHSDLISIYKNETFQTITANLPYLPNSYSSKLDLQFEPASALLGGEDGLDIYRRFFQQLKNVSSSMIIVEHLPNQKNKMDKIAYLNSLKPIKSLSDLCSVYSSNK